MFQIVRPTAEKGRSFQLTLVLLLLIGDGLGCKSASLAPSGPLRHSEHHMVNAYCMSSLNIVFFRIIWLKPIYHFVNAHLKKKKNIST